MACSLDIGPFKGIAGLEKTRYVFLGLDAHVAAASPRFEVDVHSVEQLVMATLRPEPANQSADDWNHTCAQAMFNAGLWLRGDDLPNLGFALGAYPERRRNSYVELLMLGALAAGNGRACIELAESCAGISVDVLGAGAICVGDAHTLRRSVELATKSADIGQLIRIIGASVCNTASPTLTAQLIDLACSYESDCAHRGEIRETLVRNVAYSSQQVSEQMPDQLRLRSHWSFVSRAFPVDAMEACKHIAVATGFSGIATVRQLLADADFNEGRLQAMLTWSERTDPARDKAPAFEEALAAKRFDAEVMRRVSPDTCLSMP